MNKASELMNCWMKFTMKMISDGTVPFFGGSEFINPFLSRIGFGLASGTFRAKVGNEQEVGDWMAFFLYTNQQD